MIIDYDHNPNITYDQKMQSLKESVQMALNEIDTKLNKQQEQIAEVYSMVQAIQDALNS